ncbi:transposase [Rickettsiella endosymbiont of Xylota segnis]|uniref:transposase n=1 Tax=Rickettsiella endosymbiont of Xylota segnis TaxID=3066238 RepID=UPI0030CD28B4
MAQTTEQQQFEENFKRGVEEGRRSYALKIAKRMLAMRNDPEFITVVLHNFIKEMTGLSRQDLLELEES